MPIQVYSVQTRGYNMGGSQRCNSKEEAETIYSTLLDAVSNDKPIVELMLNGNKMCVRTKDITGFGVMCHLEETPEERKARAIEQVERDLSYGNPCVEKGYSTQGALIGHGNGLI